MLKINAKLSISRPRGNRGAIAVVTIKDSLSGCIAACVELPLEQFAEALFAMGDVPCQLEFNNSGVIGKRHEHCTREVFVRTRAFEESARLRAATKAVAEYEIDGWSGNVKDCLNGHRLIRTETTGSWYTVAFHRFVEVDQSESTSAKGAT